MEYLPHDFLIRAEAPHAGFVVVPMQYQEGWQVQVNGRPVNVELIKDVVPAVPVPAGASMVRFVYRPPHWKLGLVVSSFALLVLVWLALRGRTWKRGASA
jgi:uncharacterized membrane protein YfhO